MAIKYALRMGDGKYVFLTKEKIRMEIETRMSKASIIPTSISTQTQL